MPDFDGEGFITRLELLGMKLSAIPLADGTFRLNRWRMPHASDHTQQIEALWASEIGDDQTRNHLLIAHLVANTLPGAATAR
jgi:hypothetical protein